MGRGTLYLLLKFIRGDMDEVQRLGNSAKDFLGPRPGLAIVRVRQGIVEISLRVAVLVRAITCAL